jgi:hypothetical protein
MADPIGTPKTRCLVLALTLSLIAAAPASAYCPPLLVYPQPDINSPVKFMDAIIDSLVYLRMAGPRVKQGSPPVEQLIGLAARQDDYQCASDLLSRFTSSSNRGVAQSSKLGTDTYAALVDNTKISQRLIKDFWNSPEKPGDYLSAIAKNRHDRDEFEMSLMTLSSLSVYAIVQFGPAGEATGSLNITARQRAALMKSLVDKLGPGVIQPPVDKDGTVNIVDGCGNIIYSFLAKKEWRSLPDTIDPREPRGK